ncbi:MAG: hypothetical protein QJR06_10690 [Alicyclobacillaceae bacterium]|nr:hypothetical protein [Alicyclobacillaceae bacterium]
MHPLEWVLSGILPFGVFLYSLSLGRWLWKRNIRAGAVGSVLVALLGLVLSVLGAWRPWE